MLSDCPPEGAKELLEQGPSVVGPGRSLRMVLHPEHRQAPVTNPFDGPVIQIDVSDLEIGRTLHRGLVSFDCKSMVLGSDQDAAALDRFHWVVSTPVAVGHL